MQTGTDVLPGDRADSGNTAMWVAGGGFVLVLFIILQIILGGSPPKLSDSAAKYASYFADKHSALLMNGLFHGIALIGSFFFFGGLVRRIATADRTLAFVEALSAAVTGALVTVSVGAASALSLPALRTLPGAASQAFYVFGTVIGSFGAFGLVAVTAVVAVASLQLGLFERWIGWLSAGSAVLWLVTGIGVMSDSKAFTLIGLIALIVWLAWIVVLALAFWKPSQTKVASSVA